MKQSDFKMDEKQYIHNKIVVFTVEALPSTAGAGLNAYNFSKYLSSICDAVHLCHLNYNNQQSGSDQDEKLMIRRFPYYNRNLILKLLSLPGLLSNYFRYIRKGEVIFIYSAYLIGYQFIILVGRLLKKKIIFRSTLLGGDDAVSLTSGNPVLGVINKYCLKKISLYYSINHAFTDTFQRVFDNRIPIFESIQGVNISKFYPPAKELKNRLRKKFGFSEDEFIILSVGFLLKRKGCHYIINELKKLSVPFKYIIVGEYNYSPYHKTKKHELSQMSEILNEGRRLLGDKVIFTGPVFSIEEYFQLSDLFIHGSESEGTPNALLEAMACALPCLIKKLYGISDSLAQHDYNVIEFSSFSDIPEIINSFRNFPQKAVDLGKKASQTIVENYTFEKVAEKLFQTLNAHG